VTAEREQQTSETRTIEIQEGSREKNRPPIPRITRQRPERERKNAEVAIRVRMVIKRDYG